MSINGKAYALPKAVTPENASWVREIPVSAADLKTNNELTFKAGPGHAGYLLVTASIYTQVE